MMASGGVGVENNWEKINAVQRMQDYMVIHQNEKITLQDLAEAAIYSPRHSLRAFSELIGKTPFEYLREIRLSTAAIKLRDTNMRILNIAIEASFDSHEGFTKAFTRAFAISPYDYRQSTPPIKLFAYYPVRHYYKTLMKGAVKMSSAVIFTQIIERPERILILKRGIKAKHYFDYCDEVGCDIWGILESIKGALHESIGIWLPENMRKPGTSEYCQAVEMPMDFNGIIPDGFETITVPKCHYMLFHGEPFQDEDFNDAILTVQNAIKQYNPEPFGWTWAPEVGPRFQLAPIGNRGYMEALPVQPVDKKEF
jgi:AraC-like DNA-binding protein